MSAHGKGVHIIDRFQHSYDRRIIYYSRVTNIMSDSDTGAHLPGRQFCQPNQPPISLTARDVSAIVKAGVTDALQGFQQRFDKVIAERKHENEEALLEVQSLKRANEVQFRFKGNRTQFEFNEKIAQNLETSKKLLKEGSPATAEEKLSEAVKDLRKRNKLIRLADKSEAGLYYL